MRLLNILQAKFKDFSNFPKSYVKRSQEQVHFRTPRGEPNYLPRTVQRKRFRYTTNRPWTMQFLQQNLPGTVRKKVFVTPVGEWGYFRGDRIEVLVGKDKGKQGFINQVICERNWVIAEGLNWHYRRFGNDEKFPGALIKSEAPLDVTKDIRLVDPFDLQGCEWEWRYTEEGERVRVSLRSGRIIPIPETNAKTHDYNSPKSYLEKDKDTTAVEVSRITFAPKLRTFEMDIMEEMGIKEDRVPKKTYWY